VLYFAALKPNDLGPMNVAIYARVSTKEQNVNMQLLELRDYVSKRGWARAEEFADRMSGAKSNRPALSALLTKAKARKVDVIVVWKLDRFGRSVQHLVNTIVDLNALGVTFVSLRDSLDFSTPSGKLQFHVLAAVAEFERELIRERVRAGLAAARKQGKLLGRPRADIDVLRLRKLQTKKLSERAMASELGVSRTAVVHALARL